MVKIGDLIKIKETCDVMSIKLMKGDIYEIINIQEFPKGLTLEIKIEDKGSIWIDSSNVELIND